MANITARMTVRQGTSGQLPKLLPGEFGQTTDTQRLFIGQQLVQGTPAVTSSQTEVTVEFNSAAGYPIDLDEMDSVNNLAYGITVTNGVDSSTADILGANISFVDQHATFIHALARVPAAGDLFHLWYNKEVGFDGEAFPNPVQTVAFAHTAANENTKTLVPSVDFLVANKDSVTIDYTLKTGSASRHGKLTMLLDSDVSGAPTTHSIKDEYDVSTGTIPVEFSLTPDVANKKFSLEFKTDNQTTHEFKYIQQSF